MNVFADFLAGIENPQHRERMEEVFRFITTKFPELEPVIKWNQPMFTDHGTYIIGFSVAKQHMSVAPEEVVIEKFAEDIVQAGYTHTKGLFRITWTNPVDFSLLKKMIEFNISDKADSTTFWR